MAKHSTPTQPQSKAPNNTQHAIILERHSSESGSPAVAESQARNTLGSSILSPKQSSSIIQGNNYQMNSNLPKQPPWFCSSEYLSSLSPYERLQEEILAATNYLLLTVKEAKLRERLVIIVEKTASGLWLKSKVNTVGSYSTGLYLPTSNVDVDIVVPGFNDAITQTAGLHLLSEALINAPCLTSFNIHKGVKAPLLNFAEKKFGIKFCITINSVSGTKGRDFVNNFLRKYPDAKHIILILKQFLELSTINNVSKGGLSQHALTLMIIRALQGNICYLHWEKTRHNLLAIELLEFLNLYANEFPSDSKGISVFGGGFFYNRDKMAMRNKPGITIEIRDPVVPLKNVSKSTTNFNLVKDALDTTFKSLARMIARYQLCDNNFMFNESLLSSVIQIPEPTIQQRKQISSENNEVTVV